MTVVVVGNPKPMSRTRAAAELIAERLTGGSASHVVDVVDLGAGLLGWGDPKVAEAKAIVKDADSLIVASPTYNHALPPELTLRPVLVEIGASCPAPSLYLLDSEYATSPDLDAWLQIARKLVPAVTA